jgi:hypothetical protein
MKGIRKCRPGPRVRAWMPTSFPSATTRPWGILLPNQRRSIRAISSPPTITTEFQSKMTMDAKAIR